MALSWVLATLYITQVRVEVTCLCSVRAGGSVCGDVGRVPCVNGDGEAVQTCPHVLACVPGVHASPPTPTMQC